MENAVVRLNLRRNHGGRPPLQGVFLASSWRPPEQFFWARRRDELIDKNAIFTGG
jgi:hypothetical protein